MGESGGEATAVPHYVSELEEWRGLDKAVGAAMREGMISIGSGGPGRSLQALKRELAAVQKRCTKLWAELGAQEQEYVERKLSRASTKRCFERYEALRDRYWAAHARRVELRGLIAERSRPGDDLP